MPQLLEPSKCFFRKGHLKTSSQHAPQRLHSPRLKARAATTSCLRKLILTKRRSLPWAWRARSRASSTVRDRNLCLRRSSIDVRRVLDPRLAAFIGCVPEGSQTIGEALIAHTTL